MDINEIKKKYKDEWILAEVLTMDDLNRPTNMDIIAHSKNRDEIYDLLLTVEDKKIVATLYTGEFPEGYAVSFLWEE